MFVRNTADVVLDLDGYFAPPTSQTLQFYPLTPCRVADTRSTDYPQGLGAPHLSGGTPRDLPVVNSTTCIPAGINAVAYSFNLTAIAYQGQPMGYLEVWPTGNQPANPVSTLTIPRERTLPMRPLCRRAAAATSPCLPTLTPIWPLTSTATLRRQAQVGCRFIPRRLAASSIRAALVAAS